MVQVVILGGFAGLETAFSLRQRLVDRVAHHDAKTADCLVTRVEGPRSCRLIDDQGPVLERRKPLSAARCRLLVWLVTDSQQLSGGA